MKLELKKFDSKQNVIKRSLLPRTQYKQTALTKIQSYVVEGFFCAISKPIKFILNIHEIVRGYSRYAQLKYYELQYKELKFSHLFMLITDDFQLKVPKIAKKGT